MHAGAAPVSGRQHWHLDTIEHWRSFTPPGAIQRVPQNIGDVVSTIGNEFLFTQCLFAGDAIAGLPFPMRRGAVALLHGETLLRPPVISEPAAQDATVMCAVAVVVCITLPRADRCQMRWPQRRDAPLRHGVVGNT